jgi:hypothetical protein
MSLSSLRWWRESLLYAADEADLDAVLNDYKAIVAISQNPRAGF